MHWISVYNSSCEFDFSLPRLQSTTLICSDVEFSFLTIECIWVSKNLQMSSFQTDAPLSNQAQSDWFKKIFHGLQYIQYLYFLDFSMYVYFSTAIISFVSFLMSFSRAMSLLRTCCVLRQRLRVSMLL